VTFIAETLCMIVIIYQSISLLCTRQHSRIQEMERI